MRLDRIKTKTGEWVYGECKYCPAGQNVFRYRFHRQSRTVCDKCLAQNHRENNAEYAKKNKGRLKSTTSGRMGKVKARLESLPIHHLQVQRKTIHTGSDILHMPIEKAVDTINRILDGGDLYISRKK